MKRVAVIAIFMAVMASLFAFNAVGQSLTVKESVRNSQVQSNVTINSQITRLDFVNDGTAAAAGASYIPYFICVSIYNGNSQPALVDYGQLNIQFTNNQSWIPQIRQIKNYSSDLQLVLNTSLHFVPSVDYSYGNGVVIPPHEKISLICEVDVSTDWRPTTNDYSAPVLDTIQVDSFYVSLGNYPYTGQSVDLSGVINAIEDLADTVSTSQDMSDLIAALTYSGTNYSPSYTYDNYSLVADSWGISGLSASLLRYIGSNYLTTIQTVQNGASDTSTTYATYCTPVYVKFTISNTTDNYYRFNWYNYLNNIIPTDISSFEFTYSASNCFDAVSLNNQTHQLIYYFKNPSYNFGYIPPKTNVYLIFEVNVYSHTVPIFGTPLISVPSNPVLDNNSIFVNGYRPINEYEILRDLYIAYSSVNGLDDISDSTDDISDKSEQAHVQEQSYFTQNAQAIQQTGLSNYRFNNYQENGIGSVSHDFTLLWNALGGFNSVYVFSLTLSLALMILRHAPGVIRSSRRNKEE